MKKQIGLVDDLIRQNPISKRLLTRTASDPAVMLLPINAQTETEGAQNDRSHDPPELARGAKQDYFLSRCEAGFGLK
jgi:hypothetical protein